MHAFYCNIIHWQCAFNNKRNFAISLYTLRMQISSHSIKIHTVWETYIYDGQTNALHL